MHTVTFTTRGALQKSALRRANERLALNAIRINPGISRSDLARISGLSASSISFIMNRLIREGLVLEERVENHAQVGRRPTALRLSENARMAIAVEVGFPQSRVTLVNWVGRILRQKLIPWNPSHEILAQRIHSTILSMLRPEPPEQVLGVGVGLPGTIDRQSGRVIAAENLGWFNLEFGGLLQGGPKLPYYYENNAKLSALAERWFVEPGQQALSDFVFIKPLGGLGTGVITDGHLLQGSSAMGGECGHTTFFADGLRCSCGNQGCWEQYASDKALCRLYTERTVSGKAGERAGIDALKIVDLARGGDAAARWALQEVAHALGVGIVNLIMIFNPEAIIVGDFLAEAWDMIQEKVWGVLRSRAPQYALVKLRIFPIASRHRLLAPWRRFSRFLPFFQQFRAG